MSEPNVPTHLRLIKPGGDAEFVYDYVLEPGQTTVIHDGRRWDFHSRTKMHDRDGRLVEIHMWFVDSGPAE